MIELKGGFRTEDRRLDRLPEFDERSRAFSIAPLVSAKPLKSRSWACATWLDQGREGACVSFAFHHEAAASPVPAKQFSQDQVRARYWKMQQIDPWPGGAYPGASPVYEGTSTLAGAKVMQELGYFKEYRWAFTIDDALTAISHEGPVLFGIPWLDSMFNTQMDGTLDTSGRVAGGHEIMARGIILPRYGKATITTPSKKRIVLKTTEPVVRLRNTWGRNWGIDGEGYILASKLEALLKDSGDCVIPVGRMRPKVV